MEEKRQKQPDNTTHPQEYYILLRRTRQVSFYNFIWTLALHCFALPIVLTAIWLSWCAVYVQYMSSICTVKHCTSSGHIADKYWANSEWLPKELRSITEVVPKQKQMHENQNEYNNKYNMILYNYRYVLALNHISGFLILL